MRERAHERARAKVGCPVQRLSLPYRHFALRNHGHAVLAAHADGGVARAFRGLEGIFCEEGEEGRENEREDSARLKKRERSALVWKWGARLPAVALCCRAHTVSARPHW